MAARRLPLGHKARGEAAAAAAAGTRDPRGPRITGARARYNANHTRPARDANQRHAGRTPNMGGFAPQWSLDQRGGF